jgi:hypothetical protein
MNELCAEAHAAIVSPACSCRARTRVSLPAVILAAMILSHPVAVAQETRDDSILASLGELKIQSYSIHGASPLVVVLTKAPSAGASAEHRYRKLFTDLLTRYMEMHGFSYYVVREAVVSDSIPETPEHLVDRLEAVGREVRSALWRKQLPPAAYVGLAEGAVVAARLVTMDSLSRRLAALSPSLPTDGPKGVPRWDEVVRALHNGLPVLLAMQSACDGPLPDALVSAGWQPQRLLLLPNHDSWLAALRGASCTGEHRTSTRLPSLQVAEMVAEWLRTTVPFPQ